METYDTKMLYVFTNGLTEREIAYSIAGGIQDYEEKTGDTIETFFRINVVKNQNNEPIGYAWIYLTSSKLYQLLCGNNPDGTERIEISVQKNFHRPSKPFEKMLEEKLAEIDHSSWASTVTEEEVYRKVQKMYEPPKIETKLPPLIKPRPICKPQKGTTEGYKPEATSPSFAEDYQSEGEEDEILSENNLSSRLEMVSINLSRGKLTYPRPCYVYNQLKNSNYTVIDPWMDRNLLYEIFRPYVSNWKNMEYPKIRVINEKPFTTVFIEYEEGTTDSLAALNMVKKIYLCSPQGEGVALSFNFSKNRKG